MIYNKRFLLVTLLLTCVCAASGCSYNQDMKDFWKGTKSYYHEYLNTPVKLKLAGVDSFKTYEMQLSSAMLDVESALRALARAMEDSDLSPDDEWANTMLQRFPWLSGIALTDVKGNPMVRYPDFGLKEFSVAPLLVKDKKAHMLDLRAYMQESPLGSEFYIAKPVYAAGELMGLIVAHFDIRALLAKCEHPDELMIVAGDKIAWPAIYDASSTPVSTADWDHLLRSDVTGTVDNKLGEFYWSSVYFANMPIAYAIKVAGDFPEIPAQLDVLQQASAFSVEGALNQ